MPHEVQGVVARARNAPVSLEAILVPDPGPGEALVRVEACGVCRTDLHIVEGELPSQGRPRIPGHQIVGEIAGGATSELPEGTRVVAHAVTLETEALLSGLQQRHGGELMRIEIAHVAPLGRMRSWEASRPVVQWSVVK